MGENESESPPNSQSPPSNSDSPPSQQSSPPPSSPPPSSPPPNNDSNQSPPPSSPPPSSPPPSSPPPNSDSPPDNSNSKSPPPSNNSNNNSPPSPPPPSDNQNDNNNNNNNNNKNNNNGSNNNNNNNNNKNGGNNNQWHRPPPPPPPPPPPSNTPPRALGPPSQSSKSPGSSSSSPSSPNVSIPVVAAVAAGAGVFMIMMLVVACFACRRKRKQEIDQMQFYKGSDPFYTPQCRTGFPNDQVDLPPPPGIGGRGSWPTPPPPPPGQLSSGEMSQSDYSGQHGPLMPPPPPTVALGFSQSSFTYEELAAATDGFSQQNLLGQGGFGYVHKGILPNAKEIAVKSLKSGSGQGDREFQAEVDIISRVHHRHLVSLVGYCISGGQRMLVYEYLPNNNLEFHLHGKGQPTMAWPTRLKIALGSAKGLAYLHEDCHPRIIHRDIKSSNILLDFSYDAKVADFGLAKLTSDNNTHVSTRVMGTFGYLAPEYASSGKLTEKSDVFSFGVMLLELITGRRPVDPTGAMEDSLVDWARPYCLRALEDGNYDELADPYLERNYPPHEMARMVACAAVSIRHSARRRPKMSQIVRALEGDVSLEDLNDGLKPGQASYFGGSSGVGSNSSRSSEYENSSYIEDMKRLKKMAQADLQSGPFSSEYAGTSVYGLNPSTSSSEQYVLDSRGVSPHVKPVRK